VEDIRNSKVVDVVKELKSYGVNVEVTDPRANSEHMKSEYGLELIDKTANDYDAVIVAVNHKEYISLDEEYFRSLMSPNGILVDIKGMYRGKMNNIGYWSL
jgi:UDP-N-acetyl-D-glucosamine/UDP-N-acetyl-D-galactosamine dehydrogenase